MKRTNTQTNKHTNKQTNKNKAATATKKTKPRLDHQTVKPASSQGSIRKEHCSFQISTVGRLVFVPRRRVPAEECCLVRSGSREKNNDRKNCQPSNVTLLARDMHTNAEFSPLHQIALSVYTPVASPCSVRGLL